MKIFILTILTSLVATVGSSVFAQNSGEINRFKNETLEKRANEIRMYPNPTEDFLHVKIDNSTLTEASFTVHNIIGNVVDAKVEVLGNDEFTIKVKDLPSGYYLLAIRDSQGYFKETYKFLKR